MLINKKAATNHQQRLRQACKQNKFNEEILKGEWKSLPQSHQNEFKDIDEIKQRGKTGHTVTNNTNFRNRESGNYQGRSNNIFTNNNNSSNNVFSRNSQGGSGNNRDGNGSGNFFGIF